MNGAAQAAAASTVPFDLFIIGGGINGAGIARDAAGRGLRVGLAEAADFAGATSSASTKLIHGGLRYLEHYEFRLVAEALSEREKLLDIAPHIAWPLRFVMPHVPSLRARWMIRTGLWLYDHLGGKTTLPRSHAVKLSSNGPGAGLREDIHSGFVYSDAWVDDARLVILNLKSAQQKGATILPRTRLLQARRQEGLWHCDLLSHGQISTISTRALVNAAGPWVGEVERLVGSASGGQHAAVRLVRGSHLVLPRLYEGEHAYILQNDDRRIVFMIPYEERYTLVGTTDVAQDNMAQGASMAAAEEQYLLDAINRYLKTPAQAADIVWRYAGVRPLYDDESGDPSAVTRDYTLVLDEAEQQAPLLSIYGGKITTYRRLAEAALVKLAPHFAGAGSPWTAKEVLPGGDFPRAERDAVLAGLQRDFPGLNAEWLARAFSRHGLLLRSMLQGVQASSDLGRDFGGGLFEREARWFIESEWAEEPDDVLWRRTKCGLHMSEAQRKDFADWFMQTTHTQSTHTQSTHTQATHMQAAATPTQEQE